MNKFLRSLMVGIRPASVGVVAAGLTIMSAIIGITADVEKGSLLAKQVASVFPYLADAIAWSAVAFVFASFIHSRDKEFEHSTDDKVNASLSFLLLVTPVALLVYAGVCLANASAVLKAYFDFIAK